MNTISAIFSEKAPSFTDLNIHGTLITSDWAGKKVPKPVKFLFWINETHFHFLAKDENGPGISLPTSRPNQYHAELWKYDVAEFFLMSSDRSQYLEFNLAPNGSWWTSAFSSPRQFAPGEPTAVPDVVTSVEQTMESWSAMASLPLHWLKTHYGFDEKSNLNATFILRSPDQIFLTAGDLGPGEPDFHRPDRFPRIKAISLA